MLLRSFAARVGGPSLALRRALSTIVKPDDRILVHLTCKYPNSEEVIFSTVCKDPVSLVLGQCTFIPGLDQLLPGMAVGDTLRHVFPPELAYGHRGKDEDTKSKVRLTEVDGTPEVGMSFLNNGISINVVAVDNEFMYLDTNHMFAGKELEFEVNILAVEEEDMNEAIRLHVTTFKQGDGKTFPSKGSTVHVYCVGSLASSGKEFHSWLRPGPPLSFVLGAGQVIRGLDAGVSKLSLGQHVQLYIPSSIAYGSDGDGDVVPPDEDVLFNVELVQIDDP